MITDRYIMFVRGAINSSVRYSEPASLPVVMVHSHIYVAGKHARFGPPRTTTTHIGKIHTTYRQLQVVSSLAVICRRPRFPINLFLFKSSNRNPPHFFCPFPHSTITRYYILTNMLLMTPRYLPMYVLTPSALCKPFFWGTIYLEPGW